MSVLKIQRLENNDLDFPKYSTIGSAGIDFSACTKRISISEISDDTKDHFWGDSNRCIGFSILPGKTVMVPLGFKCQIENECVMKLYVRSSVGKKGLVLANGTGIIDSDYRGELFACMRNCANIPIEIKHGDRIVQAVIQKYEHCEIVEGDVNETIRGEGGFGSTGK